MASAVSKVVDDWFLVANDPDAVTWLKGVRVVSDLRRERGSLVGIHTALATANDDIVVVAWDMPFVSSDLLRHLAELPAPVTAALATGPRGPEPFAAVYMRAALPYIEDSIARGNLRIRDLIERLPFPVLLPASRVAAFGDPRKMFFNVNTDDDLAAAEAMARED